MEMTDFSTLFDSLENYSNSTSPEYRTIGALIGLIIVVLTVIAYWKIFVKAGRPGILSLIPIVNGIVLYSIAGCIKYIISSILLLIAAMIVGAIFAADVAWVVGLVTLLAIIITVVLYIKFLSRLSRSFGHGFGFTLGLIFLPLIFVLILGFSDNTYKKI